MKEKIKTFFCAMILMCALPYIITVVLQGKENPGKDAAVLNSEAGDETVELEERVIGIVADEMPVTYEMEALKAQAVIARTNLMAAIQKGEKQPDGISQEELEKLRRKKDAGGNYQKLREAVKATEGKVITCQGDLVYAAFHAVSSGKTRSAAKALGNEELPWLVSVESAQDITSRDYLMVLFLKKEAAVQRLNAAFGEISPNAENLMASITIEEREEGDYVMQMKIGELTVSGEEFREAMGLNSACFYLREVDGEIRIVTKGLGHGLGMSQYGANELAKQGKSWTDILSSYFKNIEISD